ncbi:hypothetical protein EJB05_16073, partial [Eragrostis curvula]
MNGGAVPTPQFPFWIGIAGDQETTPLFVSLERGRSKSANPQLSMPRVAGSKRRRGAAGEEEEADIHPAPTARVTRSASAKKNRVHFQQHDPVRQITPNRRRKVSNTSSLSNPGKLHGCFNSKVVSDVIDSFCDQKKEAMKLIGLHGLVSLKPLIIHSRRLVFWLMARMDVEGMRIRLGDGTFVNLDDESVHRILGVTTTGTAVKLSKEEISDEALARLCRLLSIDGPVRYPTLDDCKRVMEMEWGPDETEETKDSFLVALAAYCAAYMFGPSQRSASIPYDILEFISEPSNLKNCNWASYILVAIKAAACRVQRNVRKGQYSVFLGGCWLYLEIMYFDHIDVGDIDQENDLLPRIAAYNKKLLAECLQADLNERNSRSGLPFGYCKNKAGREDVVEEQENYGNNEEVTEPTVAMDSEEEEVQEDAVADAVGNTTSAEPHLESQTSDLNVENQPRTSPPTQMGRSQSRLEINELMQVVEVEHTRVLEVVSKFAAEAQLENERLFVRRKVAVDDMVSAVTNKMNMLKERLMCIIRMRDDEMNSRNDPDMRDRVHEALSNSSIADFENETRISPARNSVGSANFDSFVPDGDIDEPFTPYPCMTNSEADFDTMEEQDDVVPSPALVGCNDSSVMMYNSTQSTLNRTFNFRVTVDIPSIVRQATSMHGLFGHYNHLAKKLLDEMNACMPPIAAGDATSILGAVSVDRPIAARCRQKNKVMNRPRNRDPEACYDSGSSVISTGKRLSNGSLYKRLATGPKRKTPGKRLFMDDQSEDDQVVIKREILPCDVIDEAPLAMATKFRFVGERRIPESPFVLGLEHWTCCTTMADTIHKKIQLSKADDVLRDWYVHTVPTMLRLLGKDFQVEFKRGAEISVKMFSAITRLLQQKDTSMYAVCRNKIKQWRHILPPGFAELAKRGLKDMDTEEVDSWFIGSHLTSEMEHCRLIILPSHATGWWVVYAWDMVQKQIHVLDPLLTTEGEETMLKWHDDLIDKFHDAICYCKDRLFPGWEDPLDNFNVTFHQNLNSKARSPDSALLAVHYIVNFTGTGIAQPLPTDFKKNLRRSLQYELLTMKGNKATLPPFLIQTVDLSDD